MAVLYADIAEVSDCHIIIKTSLPEVMPYEAISWRMQNGDVIFWTVEDHWFGGYEASRQPLVY